MKVSILTDKDFRYKECKELFNKSNNTLKEIFNFDDLINNFQFFQYTENDKLIGCIYFFYENERLYIASFANKGNYELKLECLRQSLNYYDCDIYAETNQRHVVLSLLKVGFKKISDNTYKYER